jgi:signal transduction histidine kinase
MINLLDNAVRHGATELRLSLQVGPEQQTLRVHDNGRGVTPEQRAALSGALAEQAYEGRMGLGLMLADLVARAHGGVLTLPAVDQGFAVELQLGSPSGPPRVP